MESSGGEGARDEGVCVGVGVRGQKRCSGVGWRSGFAG
jgi:hypothetical protein